MSDRINSDHGRRRTFGTLLAATGPAAAALAAQRNPAPAAPGNFRRPLAPEAPAFEKVSASTATAKKPGVGYLLDSGSPRSVERCGAGALARDRPPGRPASRRTRASAAVQGDRPTRIGRAHV